MRAIRLSLTAALIVAVGACSKESPAPPAPSPVAPPAGLSAVPPWVAVGTGGIQHVSVAGGIPPYSIAAGPDSIASASLSNADSSTAILKITGIMPSSAGTSVTVRDNTPSTPMTVAVPITVF